MHGDIELLSVTEDPGSDVDIWISDTAPATLDALDAGSGSPVPGGIDPTVGGLPAVGSPTWPCRIQQAGVGLCPALSAVTAIRIVGTDPNPGASGGADSFLPSGAGPFTISLAVRSVGGRGGDEFHNNWAAEFPPSEPPEPLLRRPHTDRGCHRRPGVQGRQRERHLRHRGCRHRQRDGQGVRCLQHGGRRAQTDANGRWLVDHLRPGNYRIRSVLGVPAGCSLAGSRLCRAVPRPRRECDETRPRCPRGFGWRRSWRSGDPQLRHGATAR